MAFASSPLILLYGCGLGKDGLNPAAANGGNRSDEQDWGQDCHPVPMHVASEQGIDYRTQEDADAYQQRRRRNGDHPIPVLFSGSGSPFGIA